MITKVTRTLFPAETLVLVFFVIAYFLYSGLELSFRDPLRLYLSKVLLGLVSYLFGHLLAFLFFRLREIRQAISLKVKKGLQESFRDYKGSYFSPGKLSHDLRLLHAISAMFVVYINLKHLIPYINSTLYDAPIMEFERLLFFGTSPGELLLAAIGPRWAVLLSDGYTAFYPYIAFLTVFMLLQSDRRIAQHFSFAFCLLWFLAIFVEYAVPTLGPCFYYPELFSQLPETRVTELQDELWQQKLYLDKYPRSDKGVWLISGLPSLHIGAIFLGTLYLQSLSKFVGALSWGLLAITCITTLYFGWHYLADIPSALLLVLLVRSLSTRFFTQREEV